MSLKERFDADMLESFFPTMEMAGPVIPDLLRLRDEHLFGFQISGTGAVGQFTGVAIGPPPSGMLAIIEEVIISNTSVTQNVTANWRTAGLVATASRVIRLDSRSFPPSGDLGGSLVVGNFFPVVGPPVTTFWKVLVQLGAQPIQYRQKWIIRPGTQLLLQGDALASTLEFSCSGYERSIEVAETF